MSRSGDLRHPAFSSPPATPESNSHALLQALRESEARYHSVFETSRDPIYITERDGRFIDANASLTELFGYTREELLSLNARVLYADPMDRLRFQREIERTRAVRDFEVRLKVKDGSVLTCLLSSSVRYAPDGSVVSYQGIIHDITDAKRAQEARERAEQQLVHNAFHDALTGLPNRALFLDRLERITTRARRHAGGSFAVLFLDVDRFKIINDSLGHLIGDQLLFAVARRLEACVRDEDTVARFGGDEFAILIADVPDVSDATRIASRIQQELSVPFSLDGNDIYASASVGIALSSSGYERPEEALRDADIAMYRAKTAGRSRYEVFDRAMHRQAVGLLQLETDLRKAVERSEFLLHYQPIISLRTGTLTGFEALIRWQHPTRGLLPPAEFIQLAEETGVIVPLGWWVLREACRQMTGWHALGADEALNMSVNLSPHQFAQPDLVGRIDEILRETGLSPHRLKLEITESAMMQNAGTASGLFEELRSRGIQLCIDDFGTGYSSLSYLHRFPIDTLKIDRSFISNLDEEGSSLELIETIVALSRILGLEAVAEGVETPEQLEMVRRLGSSFAQGYGISVPLPAEAAEQLIWDKKRW